MTFETKINDRIKAARKEGVAEGRVEGYIEGMITLVRDNLISVDIAAEKSGLSVEEFTQKMVSASDYEDQAEYGTKQP